jgi:type I restriction enzyme, S subunit
VQRRQLPPWPTIEEQGWSLNPGRYVGVTAYFNHAVPFNHLRINSGMVILRCDETKLLSAFLYHFLRSSSFISQVNGLRSGAAQPQLPIRDMRQISLPLPPLQTQRKIAAILSAYDDLIENNLRRIKILEEMAQNLYREWFVKFRFPGHQNARFVDSPLGRIPEGWEMAELGRFANQIRDGVNPNSVNPDTPYIGLEHLPRKSISVNDWGRAGDVQSTKLIFKESDILFGKIRPYFHKVGVAPFSGICSSDTIVIRPKMASLFGLILGCTSSSEFVEHATATSQGTKMPRANWDVLVKYQIPMPPPPILSQLNEFIVEIVSQIHNFIFRIQNLRRTRDLLLPKLISGAVDVSELDIMVPEEVTT